MAPPPDYDREPKAPDKSATIITNEDTKFYSSLNDQQLKSDHKTSNTAANSEGEKSKGEDSVENLDDGRLRALLDEAITYKCPKDREGKSDLFKNLLEEAELDDQASEAVARASSGGGRVRRGAGRRPPLAHSNSLQDLVAAALAAEPAPRRPRPHAPVSARATHGGSLPSGVDTSFLLGEEPTRAGYLATVRCVNPPPFAERRVSASDANCPAEIELLHRRSKPVFPVTYTARATLEIGSGSVSSGRAVTTTTASNQVRTSRPTTRPPRHPHPPDLNQSKLMNAIRHPATRGRKHGDPRGPHNDYDKFAIPWNEITLRYAPNSETAAAGTSRQMRTPEPMNSWHGNEVGATPRQVESFRVSETTPSGYRMKTSNDKKFTVPARRTNPSNKCITVPPTRQTKPSNENKTASTSSSHENKPIASTRRTRPFEGNLSQNEPMSEKTPSTAKKITTVERRTKFYHNKNFISAQQIETLSENKKTPPSCRTKSYTENKSTGTIPQKKNDMWINGVDKWYEGLNVYTPKLQNINELNIMQYKENIYQKKDHYANNDILPALVKKVPIKNSTDKLYPINAHLSMNNNPVGLFHNTSNEKMRKSCPACGFQDTEFTKRSLDRDRRCKLNENISDIEESDINILRKKYRERVGYLVRSLSPINPRNVRLMTIGNIPTPVVSAPIISDTKDNNVKSLKTENVKNISVVSKSHEQTEIMKTEKCDNTKDMSMSNTDNNINNYDTPKFDKAINLKEMKENKCSEKLEEKVELKTTDLELIHNKKIIENTSENSNNIEMVEMSLCNTNPDKESFSQYCADQKRLLQILEEAVKCENSEEIKIEELVSNHQDEKNYPFDQHCSEEQKLLQELKICKEDCYTEEGLHQLDNINENDNSNSREEENKDNNRTDVKKPCTSTKTIQHDEYEGASATDNDIIIKLNTNSKDSSNDQLILSELQHNAYVFLTMPNRLLTPSQSTEKKSIPIRELQNDVSANIEVRSTNISGKKSKKRKDRTVGITDAKKKENMNKTALKVLLFENLKHDSLKAEASSETDKEADSAIPFSCITTPEVVSSCNTTSSTSQSAVAVDPKPLQLGSCYRAVSSLTGDAPDPAPPSAAPAVSPSVAPPPPVTQPRSVISSSFNGLSLSRPNYGSTASTAPDEYKKSLDENGNAVQGFSSPISGSSQHKKPRRKKSSKNETVIKSHQIDGYQGNKDINEVLRFIESNAEHGRGAKLGRTKHKDDSDDKGGKKRSTERRKDKENKMKRASSLEELSRTKLEDLTDTREPQHRQDRKPRPDNKAERRSWGDDARDSFYYTERAPPAAGHDHEPTSVDVAPEPATELTDFQTVTKRRKPRRRADEPEREPPRRPRPPSPRPRRESAPPSDRSNDSNDDLDSVHSLPPPPPPPPPPAPHASYADIARTRHNIPDLIESCNFYAEEGENPGVRRTADAPAAAAAGDADGYPALGGTVRPARGKVPPRRERKERPATTTVAECPAPDVVGDRRPAVILLDSAAQPRDMDGVTFGFDINEQLLGSGARRPRCDLVRDALDAGSAAGVAGAAVAAGGGGAVAVVAGCTPLRYVPPDPPPDTHHLHQIIEYVCTAWEDVVRCGGGKVRYFSE